MSWPSAAAAGPGVITSYTAAQLAAMALAGTLTPNASYIASNNRARHFAPDAFTLEPDGPRSVIERRWRAKRDIALRAIAEVTAGVGGKVWEDNATISAAGTYTGRFFRTLTTGHACKVTTSDPVVFRDCIFWSATHPTPGNASGTPVYTGNGGGIYSTVEFHNCIFRSDFQDKSSTSTTRSICERPEAMLIENCTFIGAGLRVYNTATVTQFIFRRNFAYNLDYRQGDGAGGYNGSMFEYAWLQFTSMQGMEGVVIEHNESVARPYETSSVDYGVCEDVFSFSDSGGTVGDPVKVRHNCFYGNYSVIGAAASSPDASGAAVQIEAASSTTPSKYIDVEYNRVIACSAGIALSTCNSCNVRYNTILCAGYVQDTTAATYSDGYGTYGQNSDSGGPTYVFDRAFSNNIVGHARRAGTENHVSAGMNPVYDVVTSGEDHATFTNETYLAIGDCTQAAEEALYQEWLDECAALGIEVGYTG